ncbi:MAG: iron ABC transporter permease [Acidobacteriota bacterium]|nr:iron ABC transporter permease [Acidobacteriota bacterium]
MSRAEGRSRATLAALAVVWLAVLCIGPAIGSQDVSLTDLFSEDSATRTIIWRLRMPRVLLGLLAGGALAIGGVAFQTLFRNPLAEPYTLGLASGAALGAVVVQHLELAGSAAGFPLVSVASFAGAVLVGLLILGLARGRGGIETSTLLLAGIAVSLSCSAFILFIQYLADFTRTFRMVRWMMGGLAVVGYREVVWVGLWTAAGFTALFLLRRDLDQLLTGEELASSRGVDLDRLRLLVLAAVSGMVGALVAVAGPIGFVGLVVPHILRRWIGHHHLALLPASLLGGGAFLALCDLAARRVLAPMELPVGILTALLGGPFFLWLLLSRRRRRG